MDDPAHEAEPPADAAPFGARYLAEYRRLGGNLSAFSFAEVQELKACDREGLVRALRRAQPLTPWAAIQRIRSAESPEQLAREVSQELRAQAAAASASLWVILALAT